MNKLVNEPATMVAQSLEGFALAHADLVRLDRDPFVVRRATGPVPDKVGLVSGGGSGHEPLHVGFVGLGMLDAAAPGEVFTSPTPDHFLAAIEAGDGGAGVVLVVKNYTGDVLNAEMAVELAADAGIEVRSVLVDDDVAVEDSLYSAGRRGVAGTLLVEKIAGAAAERGERLDAVAAVAARTVSGVRSMGVALRACTVPYTGRPSFDLPDGEIEIGIGIHGEPGRRRVPTAPADEVTAMLLEPIVADLHLRAGERVLLLVNGMGGTPAAELAIVFRRAHALLAEAGVVVDRALVGSYVTSLDMQGASLSVLRLDDELTALWDAPVTTAGLRW